MFVSMSASAMVWHGVVTLAVGAAIGGLIVWGLGKTGVLSF